MKGQKSTVAPDGARSNQSVSAVNQIVTEIIESPLNIALLAACIILGCLIYRSRRQRHEEQRELAQLQTRTLPKMKKRDFTVEELRQYDGNGPDGRILISVNHTVYDVTKASRHYGPEGPYGVFAGRDASRGLAKFSIKPDEITDKYDDLSDLTQQEMASVREWQEQFEEKYPRIGRLLKPNEEATDYTDDEEDEPKSNQTKPSNIPATSDTHEAQKTK